MLSARLAARSRPLLRVQRALSSEGRQFSSANPRVPRSRHCSPGCSRRHCARGASRDAGDGAAGGAARAARVGLGGAHICADADGPPTSRHPSWPAVAHWCMGGRTGQAQIPQAAGDVPQGSPRPLLPCPRPWAHAVQGEISIEESASRVGFELPEAGVYPDDGLLTSPNTGGVRAFKNEQDKQ